MLTFLFNLLFYVGRQVARFGAFLQDLAVYLHIRFKTKTGIKLAVAIDATRQMLAQVKQQATGQAPTPPQQGVSKNESFRSFFISKKPGNS